jgi:hypothetical protein
MAGDEGRRRSLGAAEKGPDLLLIGTFRVFGVRRPTDAAIE